MSEQKKALVGNASDEDQVKKAKKKEKRRRDEELLEIRELLKLPHFRRLVWSWMESCHVFESIWSEGPVIHFREGQRNVGLMMLADITKADPEAFVRMMKEAKESAENNG